MIIKALSEPNKNSVWLALGWTVMMLLLSFKAPSVNPKYIFPNQDKVVHFMFYFVFVFLWYRYLYFLKQKGVKIIVFVVALAVMTGIGVEFLQGALTRDRHSDIYDVLANSLGAITGAFFSLSILKKEKP
ncbi:VanZ family protein [Flavobacterium sp. H122]|uniref:VanZ family protein n=1 Tax=Flavobacterium sp. H122 TaxID=2529860 RepID=UPI0010AB1CC6|nr:VanZ family protein [Flavobacterium sp. H122]